MVFYQGKKGEYSTDGGPNQGGASTLSGKKGEEKEITSNKKEKMIPIIKKGTSILRERRRKGG